VPASTLHGWRNGISTTQHGNTPRSRTGDNLYPEHFRACFADIELDLDVPAGVWNPTPHGLHLGDMLARELRFDDQHVLELGTGCGLHAIVLARRGAARLTLTDIDQESLDNALHNLEKHGIDVPVEALVADWTHVPGGPFDALVTNPPFCKSGKRFRRHFIETLILDAHKLVRPGGTLTFVQSSMANVPRSLALMEECGMTVRIVGETDEPFRPYYFEDARFMREIACVPGAYEVRSGTHFERLVVLQGTLPREAS
jgi:release factor glutamine methyltransferase